MMSLFAVAAVAGPAWAQAKSELTIALSSFSAETVDPALQGHNVKYYLSLMFDYLVGTTPPPTASRRRPAASPVSGRTPPTTSAGRSISARA